MPLRLLKLMFVFGETEARGGGRLVLLNGCSKAEAGRSRCWEPCGDATCCGSSVTALQSSPFLGFTLRSPSLALSQDRLNLALALDRAEQSKGDVWAQRLSQHAAQDATRLQVFDCRGSAQQPQTRPYKWSQGFCLCFCFAAALQLPRRAGTRRPGAATPSGRGKARDELPNFHRAKRGHSPCSFRRGSKASWLHLVETTK